MRSPAPAAETARWSSWKEGVRKFDNATGRALHGFESNTLDDPSGVGVDGNGFVYVLDRNHGLVFEFSNDLTYLNTFGGQGTDGGRFTAPVDVDYDSPAPVGGWNGHVYVLDQATGLIQVFGYPHGEEAETKRSD
jgi:hypothetical protein